MGVSRKNNTRIMIFGVFSANIFFLVLLSTQGVDAGSRKIYKSGEIKDESNNRTIDCITSGISTELDSFLLKINSTLSDLPNTIVSKFNQANSTVSNISSLLTSTLEFIPFYIQTKINNTLKSIPKAITSKLDQVNSSLSTGPNLLSNKFSQLNSTVGALPGLINSTLNFIPSLITSVTALVEQFMTIVLNFVDSALNSDKIPSFLKGIIDKLKLTTGIGLDKPAGSGCNRADVLLLGNIPGTFIGVPLVILGIYILVASVAAVIVAIGGLGETITDKIYADLDFTNLGNHNSNNADQIQTRNDSIVSSLKMNPKWNELRRKLDKKVRPSVGTRHYTTNPHSFK